MRVRGEGRELEREKGEEGLGGDVIGALVHIYHP